MKNTIIPALRSVDPDALAAFLTRAFGFVERAVHRDEAGRADHIELTFDGGMVMIGREGRGTEFDPLMSASAPVRTTMYVVVDDV
ncbi:MAG: glyoxalase, partial [Myxococcota bacterium]